jgi:hypothetical protein
MLPPAPTLNEVLHLSPVAHTTIWHPAAGVIVVHLKGVTDRYRLITEAGYETNLNEPCVCSSENSPFFVMHPDRPSGEVTPDIASPISAKAQIGRGSFSMEAKT